MLFKTCRGHHSTINTKSVYVAITFQSLKMIAEPDAVKPVSMMCSRCLTSADDQQKNKRASTFGSCIWCHLCCTAASVSDDNEAYNSIQCNIIQTHNNQQNKIINKV